MKKVNPLNRSNKKNGKFYSLSCIKTHEKFSFVINDYVKEIGQNCQSLCMSKAFFLSCCNDNNNYY